MKARDTEVRDCRLKIEQLIAQLNQAKQDLKKAGSNGDKTALSLNPEDKKKMNSLEEELKRLRQKYEEKKAECTQTTSLLTELKARYKTQGDRLNGLIEERDELNALVDGLRSDISHLTQNMQSKIDHLHADHGIHIFIDVFTPIKMFHANHFIYTCLFMYR